MAFDLRLADRIRERLLKIPAVEEKEMFKGITFMVDGKMCVSVSGDELMCRINPAMQDELLEDSHCRPMLHGGKIMRGFIYVEASGFSRNEDFEKWISLSLDYNKIARASPKKKKKIGGAE